MKLTAAKLNALYEATKGKGLEGTVTINMPNTFPMDKDEICRMIDRLNVEGFTVVLDILDLDGATITVFF